ncbi:hypothetical protein INT43_003343, partial [Umbelopsis isabellina]
MKFYREAALFTLVSSLTSLVSANSVEKRSDADGLLKFGYNPPRVNPDYCTGIRITQPTYPGLAFQNGSISQIYWEVADNIANTPNIVTRIRVLNSTQHNHLTVGENFSKCAILEPEFHQKLLLINFAALLNEGRLGFQTHNMDIDGPTGLYHYRIMVNYQGKPTHCVYESVPFMVIQGIY